MERITDILSAIPGYDGYRSTENRRDTDRRVREEIGSQLGGYAGQVESVATALADQRAITAVGPVSIAAKAIRHIQDLILTTSYGYGGLYSDKNVDDLALEQIIQFDRDLLTLVKGLGPAIEQLQAATDESTRSAALDAIDETIDGLKLRFDERSGVVETGRASAPSSTTSPLSVLEREKTKPLPPAAFNLKNGDAISVAGSNYIVDATIAVDGEQPLKLARIDVAPERWLVVSQRFAADTQRGEITIGADSAVIDGETVPLHGRGTATANVFGLTGKSGKQSVQYQVYGGSSGGGPIAFVLNWASDSLQLVGRAIAFDDIEIYGQPETR